LTGCWSGPFLKEDEGWDFEGEHRRGGRTNRNREELKIEEMKGAPVSGEAGRPFMVDRIESLAGFAFVPRDVLDVMERISMAGFGVWLVGGALRDFLTGRPTKDWDLATSAGPQQVMGMFPKVFPVGIRFGTVAIHTPERDVEVTSCPSPGLDGIIADLNRRDFTVNALGLSYPDGRLLDLHGGMDDLASRTLRCVGNARQRFREDCLRVLRACRFVSVSGFRIHRDTLAAMKCEAYGLERVAQERIRDEVLKTILGSQVVRSFETMRRSGILRMVLPELDAGYRKKRGPAGVWDAFHHTLYTVQLSPQRRRVRLVALFQDIAKPFIPRKKSGGSAHSILREESSRMASNVMWRWRMSKREIREVALLVGSQLQTGSGRWRESEMRRLYGLLGPELLGDLMDLARARCSFQSSRNALLRRLELLRGKFSLLAAEKPVAGIKDLAVSGKDVMEALGLKQGPQVRMVLEDLYRKVLDDPMLNDYGQLMGLLARISNRGRYGHLGRK